MTQKFPIWLWIFLALITGPSVYAGPDKPFTGTITYTITMSGNIPAEMESMMPKKAHYLVSGKKVRIDMEPTVQGAGGIITDYEKNTMRMQLEIPGAKYQMVMDEELEAQTGAIKDIAYTGEKKRIAGFTCEKALVTGLDGEQTEVWFSDKIQVEGQDRMWGKLKGFPMEFSKTNEGLTMLYSAEAVKPGKIDPKQFEMPTDYQPISQEELIRLFTGGMD